MVLMTSSRMDAVLVPTSENWSAALKRPDLIIRVSGRGDVAACCSRSSVGQNFAGLVTQDDDTGILSPRQPAGPGIDGLINVTPVLRKTNLDALGEKGCGVLDVELVKRSLPREPAGIKTGSSCGSMKGHWLHIWLHGARNE